MKPHSPGSALEPKSGPQQTTPPASLQARKGFLDGSQPKTFADPGPTFAGQWGGGPQQTTLPCKPASLQRFSGGVPTPNLCRSWPNLCRSRPNLCSDPNLCSMLLPTSVGEWLGTGLRSCVWPAKVWGITAKVRGNAAKVQEEAAKVWGWDPLRKPLQACRLAKVGTDQF